MTSEERTEEQESMEPRLESPEASPVPMRRSRKRTRFSIPQPPARSVKALWEQASPSEQHRAHRYGMAILETWLGKRSRQEVADELGLPVLRIWQLSQQAVSGMLAGLLTQPRTRRDPSMPPLPPDDDPKVLRKKIAKLEQDLKCANELIEVLKLLPGRPSPPPEKEEPRTSRSKQKAAGKKRASSPAPSGPKTPDRSDARTPEDKEGTQG